MGNLAKSSSLPRKQLPWYINKRSKINILQQKIKGTCTTRGGKKIKSCLNLNSNICPAKILVSTLRGRRCHLQQKEKVPRLFVLPVRLFSGGRTSADSGSFPRCPQASPRAHRRVAETLRAKTRKKGPGDTPGSRPFNLQGKPRTTSPATRLHR